jgi:N6-L-threonylcarbamoyladenine synthase
MLASGDLNVSFSGLKTAVRAIAHDPRLDERGRADLAASFEQAVVDVLTAKALAALEQTRLDAVVVAGGVGANRRLRQQLTAAAEAGGSRVFYPEPALCTDNGAMIAFAGALRLAHGARCESAFTVHPRWELESVLAPGA